MQANVFFYGLTPFFSTIWAIHGGQTVSSRGRTWKNSGKEPPTHEKLQASFLTKLHLS